jgi:hypothetical protein
VNERHRNRLADEPSLYLRQHGHNPVDWYPWGREALERARAEDKPILLSIGYSSCHWCHVMERECFENDDIAALMNRLFICIKVDREERPDLDGVYMKALQMMTGRGGWPMTVFLRPDLRPFYAGTYFPPVDRGQMPAFPRVLVGVASAYHEQREELGQRADQVVELLERSNEGPGGERVDDAQLDEAAGKLESVMDGEYGGFGGAPKFPNALALSFLLGRASAADARHEARAASVKLALDKMADGGIYDHLGGGFHRYSVDRQWLVPHFEKMLYDQALLCDIYLEGWQRFGEPRYAEVVTGILDYLVREMIGADGGFFATQDADSEGEEGRFFVWTPRQVEEVVGAEDAEVVCRFYDVSDSGNFEGRNILRRTISIDDLARMYDRSVEDTRDTIDRARRSLFARRAERVPPATDVKHLADWNGLMIGAMAKAGRALQREDFVAAARRAADFVRARMFSGTTLMHFATDSGCRVAGFLDDHACFGRGCLELFFAGARRADLDSACMAADVLCDRFEDAARGGFFFTAAGEEAPLLRSRDLMDGAVPSGNSVATELLLRLWQLTGRDRYRAVGERALEALLPSAVAHPHGGGHMLNVAQRHRRGYGVVVITDADSAEGSAMVHRALELHAPELSVLALSAGPEPGWLPEPVRGKSTAAAAATVCRAGTCFTPAHSAADLESTMLSSRG